MKYLAYVLCALVLACGSEEPPEPSAVGGEERAPAWGPERIEEILERLPALPLREPEIPEDAVRASLGDAGGTVSLDDVDAVVPREAVRGEIELALWRRTAMEELPWNDRLQPLGEPFSIMALGKGALADGELRVAYDPDDVPEGWDVFLLVHTPRARPAAPPDEGEPVPSWAVDCGLEAAPGSFRMKLYPIVRADDTLGPYLQLIRAKGVERHVVRADGKVVFCIFVLDAPPHGKDAYVERLEAALLHARRAAIELGLRAPSYPIHATVVHWPLTKHSREQTMKPRTLGASQWHLMALRSDLHLLPQYALEWVAAHEYFHLLEAACLFRPAVTTAHVRQGEGSNWLFEGGADWFAQEAFDEAWSRGHWDETMSLEGLTRMAYGAYPFWMFLEERYCGILAALHDVNWKHAWRSMGLDARGGGEPVPPWLYINYEALLDALLESEGDSLANAYAQFAASFLYRRDFAQDEVGNGLHPEMFFGLEETDFTMPRRWGQYDLTGTSSRWATKISNPVEAELSAMAFRLRAAADRGEGKIVVTRPTVLDATPARPRLHIFCFGERGGRVVETFEREVPEGGLTFTISDLGPEDSSAKYDGVAVILVNTGWLKWRYDEEDELFEGYDAGERLRFDVYAYLDEWKRVLPGSALAGVPGVTGASGTKYCVSRSGHKDCFGSIQEAIDNDEVEDGDTIFVHPGTYEESIVLRKGVTVTAAPGTVTVKGGLPTATLAADGATLANLILEGPHTGVPVGNMVTLSATKCRLIGNVISATGTGVWIQEGGGHQVESNWIHVRYNGVYAHGSTGVTIRNNVIFPPTRPGGLRQPRATPRGVEYPGEKDKPVTAIDYGISLSRSTGKVIGNYVGPPDLWDNRRTYVEALHLTTCPSVTVENNRLHTFDTAIWIRDCGDLVIKGNWVSGGTGMNAEDVGSVLLEGNRFRAGSAAIAASKVKRIDLLMNSFSVRGASDRHGVSFADFEELTSNRDRIRGGTISAFHVEQGATATVTRADFDGQHRGAIFQRIGFVTLEKATLGQTMQPSSWTYDDPMPYAALVLEEVPLLELKGLTLAPEYRGFHANGCKGNLKGEDVRVVTRRLEVQTAFSARDTRIELKDLWLSPETATIAEVRDGEIVLRNARVGAPGQPPLAAFVGISLADDPGKYKPEDIPEETEKERLERLHNETAEERGERFVREMTIGASTLSQRQLPMFNLPARGDRTFRLPYIWTLWGGSCRFRAVLDLDASRAPVPLEDVGQYIWEFNDRQYRIDKTDILKADGLRALSFRIESVK